MYYAVEGGHLKVAQWLFKNGVKESKNAPNAAAEEGHLEILQWLHSKGISRCTDHGVDGAAKNGHLGVLKWLHKTLKGAVEQLNCTFRSRMVTSKLPNGSITTSRPVLLGKWGALRRLQPDTDMWRFSSGYISTSRTSFPRLPWMSPLKRAAWMC